jgi:hypothetical protein
MSTGVKAESIYPRSFVASGLRLVGISLRLGENWFQPNGRLKDMACPVDFPVKFKPLIITILGAVILSWN